MKGMISAAQQIGNAKKTLFYTSVAVLFVCLLLRVGGYGYVARSSLLFWAVRGGHANVVWTLLTLGVAPDGRDHCGDTPLHDAVAFSRARKPQGTRIIELLLKHGANINTYDNRGRTPLEHCWPCPKGELTTTDSDSYDAIKRLLRSYGARTGKEVLLARVAAPNLRDGKCRTPLHWAADRRYANIVGLLLANGANVNVVDEEGLTPLHLAAENSITDIAGLLLDHGAKVNARDSFGRTPLHIAAWWGYCPSARLLLSNGADPNAVDKEGKTPLDLCCAVIYEATFNVLREYGARTGRQLR